MVALALPFFLTLNPEGVKASHFRYGHLTWQPAGVNTARFSLTDAFRRDGFLGTSGDGYAAVGDIITESIGATELSFGDGVLTPVLQFKVTAIDPANNWLLAIALEPGSTTKTSVDHTYSSPTNGGAPWLAQINSCCRTSGEINNPGGTYQVQTLVELSSGNTSPSSSLPAIVNVPQSAAATFFVPGADPDASSTLTWRLATTTEDGGLNQPVGLTINNLTGLVTWNTLSAVLGGLYSCQIIIEDRDLANTSIVKTQVAVDFLMFITTCSPTNATPAFVAPSPTCGSTMTTSVGVPISFSVTASDADVADIVSLNSGGVPSGATMSPSLPTPGNPVSSTFSWTPGVGQQGSYVVTFSASDNCGAQSLCSYTINVTACNISVSAGPNEQSFFGAANYQTLTHTAVVTGGTPPFSYTWTLNRPLLCNQVNSSGDEIFATTGGACTNTICPTTGSLAVAPSCSGSATINATLITDGTVCVTVTDANNCSATSCFLISAVDARCFAGNSTIKKVKVCHRTSSATRPWVQICISRSALAAHLTKNPGDYVGNCVTTSSVRYSSDYELSTDGEFEMSVYPNPANNILNIEFESSSVTAYQIHIYDVIGRDAYSQEGVAIAEGNKLSFPITGLAIGIYYLRFTLGEQSTSVRLIVSE